MNTKRMEAKKVHSFCEGNSVSLAAAGIDGLRTGVSDSPFYLQGEEAGCQGYGGYVVVAEFHGIQAGARLALLVYDSDLPDHSDAFVSPGATVCWQSDGSKDSGALILEGIRPTRRYFQARASISGSAAIQGPLFVIRTFPKIVPAGQGDGILAFNSLYLR